MGDNPGREEAIKSMHPKYMMLMTVGLFMFYQILIFSIWIYCPQEWHLWINRWSWSSADAMALAAIFFSNYVYWRTWGMASPEEANYMKQVFDECRKAGVTPKIIGIVIKSQFGKRIERVNKMLKEGKVSEEELIEALK